MSEQVAITGMGIVCSLGLSRDEVALQARAGRRSFAPLRAFDASGFKVNLAAEAPALVSAGNAAAACASASINRRGARWPSVKRPSPGGRRRMSSAESSPIWTTSSTKRKGERCGMRSSRPTDTGAPGRRNAALMPVERSSPAGP